MQDDDDKILRIRKPCANTCTLSRSQGGGANILTVPLPRHEHNLLPSVPSPPAGALGVYSAPRAAAWWPSEEKSWSANDVPSLASHNLTNDPDGTGTGPQKQ